MQLTPEEKANYGDNPFFKYWKKPNPEEILDANFICTFQVEAQNEQGADCDRSAVGANGRF